MRVVRIALMLLALILVIGVGTPAGPSGQNKATPKQNKPWPTCPPDCGP